MRNASQLLLVLSLLCVTVACEVSAGDPIDGSLFDDAGPNGDGDGGGDGDGDGDGDSDAGDEMDGGAEADAATDGGTTGAPAISALPGMLAAATCSALDACLGPQLLADRLDGRDCTVLHEKTLAEGSMQYLDESVSAGLVVYTASEMQDCLDAIDALGCEVETTRWPAACQLAVTGTVAEGGDCTIDEDCQGKAFCEKGPATCPGVCSPLLAENATCNDNRECDDGLVCFEGSCEAPGVAADSCGTGLPECKAGFECRRVDPAVAGVSECKAIATVHTKTLGQACNVNGDLCISGLVCASTGAGSAGECEELADIGGDCKRSAPNQCQVSQYCNAVDPGDVGTCLEQPLNGEACLTGRSQVCADGHVCVDEGASDVCRPVNDAGEACATDAQCYSGICNDPTCEAPLMCPAP
jgi:hypothetical protein